MAISDNVQAVMDKIQAEKIASMGASATGDNVQRLAIEAILGGSAEWAEYMKLYAAADPAFLAKLIPTDGTGGDVVKRKARAYLVANGVCGAGTTGLLNDNVTVKLD